jgi:hypothetical protein
VHDTNRPGGPRPRKQVVDAAHRCVDAVEASLTLLSEMPEAVVVIIPERPRGSRDEGRSSGAVVVSIKVSAITITRSPYSWLSISCSHE